MITIDSVYLSLNPDEKPVLSDISWTINSGEKWILFGRNGSGKTKLLETITGYRRPSKGEIIRFGYPQTGHDIRTIRKKIGYLSTPIREKILPQERAVDLVASGFFSTAGLYDTPGKEHLEYAEYMLEQSNLAHRKNDYFSHFSEGEKQKLLLARAMTGTPELLILDEPCSGLDIAAREELLETLDTFFNEGGSHKDTALIFVTHHVEEITSLFSSIYMISSGKSFFNGPVTEGITSEKLSTLFNLGIEVYVSNSRYHTALTGSKGDK